MASTMANTFMVKTKWQILLWQKLKQVLWQILLWQKLNDKYNYGKN